MTHPPGNPPSDPGGGSNGTTGPGRTSPLTPDPQPASYAVGRDGGRAITHPAGVPATRVNRMIRSDLGMVLTAAAAISTFVLCWVGMR